MVNLSVIPGFGRLRQEDCKFEASQDLPGFGRLREEDCKVEVSQR
jgi:hypothetical protein